MDIMNMSYERREGIVRRLRDQYPPGTEVELVSMNDPHTRLVPGTQGTVSCVDDMGTIHVNWENGSGLGVAYGEDRIKKVPLVTGGIR